MSEASAIRCGLPFCQDAKAAKMDQTKLSIGLRITAVALGSIAMLIGILILCNIPGLGQLGTTAGWITLVTGAFFVLLGVSIKHVKTNSNNKPKHQKNNIKVPQTDLPPQNNSDPLSGLNQSNTTSVKEVQHTRKNTKKPKSQPPEHPVELARREALDWFSQEGKKLGQGQYEAVFAKTKQIAKGLPNEEMTLHRHSFRFGFTFFYAEKQGEKKYIPIALSEGVIMNWQTTEEGGCAWPFFDAQKNTYVTPKITVIDTDPPTGSMSNDEYFHHILSAARHNRDSNEYRILEALIPYAARLKRDCGDSWYNQIRSLIPEYPETPV